MSLVIRPATAEDLPLYLRLLPELGVDDPPPSPEQWRTLLQPATHIAERHGVPLGLCHWVPMGDGGHVRQLIVDPKARRTGAGRALLEFVAAQLRAGGATKWELNVKPENAAAIRLYESVGFRRAYGSSALRLTWAQVDTLPASPPSAQRQLTSADDASLERLFHLPAGHVRWLREVHRVLLALVDPDGRWSGFAAFNPSYPGAFPFRVTTPSLARALLEAMRPHALQGATFVGVVVEDDDALAALLRAHGAEVRTLVDHYAGPL